MQTLEFTAGDLARTRVAPMAGPLTETVLALGVATGLRPRIRIGSWTASAPRRVGRAERELAGLLHPMPHNSVDVFTLARVGGSIEAGSIDHELATLREAPRDHVATEVRAVWGPGGSPVVRGLRNAEKPALARLAAALGAAYHRLVEPYWPAFGQLAEGHRGHLERSLATRGVAATLAEVGGGATWEGTTLRLPQAGLWSDGPVASALAGRGLVLAPTVLADRPMPWFPLDPSQPVVLLCPVPEPRLGEAVTASSSSSLDRLVGRSRSHVLRQVARTSQGHSTSEVAQLVHISPASASEHLTVLREAGLVDSVRRHQRMVHTVTPLGRRLLGG
jgi:DNA-binding transcriptional ArsR family regulator